jgi:hypothetical protein
LQCYYECCTRGEGYPGAEGSAGRARSLRADLAERVAARTHGLGKRELRSVIGNAGGEFTVLLESLADAGAGAVEIQRLTLPNGSPFFQVGMAGAFATA